MPVHLGDLPDRARRDMAANLHGRRAFDAGTNLDRSPDHVLLVSMQAFFYPIELFDRSPDVGIRLL